MRNYHHHALVLLPSINNGYDEIAVVDAEFSLHKQFSALVSPAERKGKGQKYKNTGDEEKTLLPYILWLEKRRFLIVKRRFLIGKTPF
ncbi:MAG: hypothetical protein ACI3ZB_08975, partial [Prevotella sp.]